MRTVVTVVVVMLVLAALQRRFLRRGMTSSVVSDDGDGVPVRLLSASSTTGWLDWIHGELLLLPDGLLRIRQNLAKTAAKGNAALVQGQAIELVADPDKLAAATAHRRSTWVPATAIDAYDLTRGPMSGKLLLHLAGGGRQTFLFLVQDMDYQALEEALQAWGATPRSTVTD